MIHPLTFLKGVGFGAGMMYFFDPASGNRRRALVRDQIVHACTVCDQQTGAAYRDASNRLQGAKAELGKALESSDQPLMERVQEGVIGAGRTLGMQGRTWSPTAKATAMLGGAGLIASLMSKRDLVPLAFGVLGLSFAAKELADQEQRHSGQQQNEAGAQPQGGQQHTGVGRETRGQAAAQTQGTQQQGTGSQSKVSEEGAGREASVSKR